MSTSFKYIEEKTRLDKEIEKAKKSGDHSKANRLINQAYPRRSRGNLSFGGTDLGRKIRKNVSRKIGDEARTNRVRSSADLYSGAKSYKDKADIIKKRGEIHRQGSKAARIMGKFNPKVEEEHYKAIGGMAHHAYKERQLGDKNKRQPYSMKDRYRQTKFKTKKKYREADPKTKMALKGGGGALAAGAAIYGAKKYIDKRKKKKNKHVSELYISYLY